ncbi:MAG: NAD(P)H-hydrate epimerase [Candidatus Odinarchaeota archaeon]
MIPYVTVEQMREIDRVMIEEYQIQLIQMMENAGRNLAQLSRSRFLSNPEEKSVLVLAGTGGNGAGGLVSARHLHNWGADVSVLLAKIPSEYLGVPAHQLTILQRMGLNADLFSSKTIPSRIDLIIDAILGYSLSGNPRGLVAEMIRWVKNTMAPVLALDNPSGIDPDGIIYEPAIKATATMTLALPKEGFKSETVKKYLGELYLADIGVPLDLYSRMGIDLNSGSLFSTEEIIRLL